MEFLDRTLTLPFTKRIVTWRYAAMHTLYWTLITGFFIYEKRYLLYKVGTPYFVACVTGRILLLILIAYLNLHYFLPRFLLRKRYVAYFSMVVLSVLAYMLLQSLFDIYLYGYVLGPMRNSHWGETLSYNFFSTLWYIGLMLAMKLSVDWYEQQSQLQKISLEKLQAEVSLLRSQVNPHFLFNVLNNLYALTLAKSDQAPDVVLKLSEMMEYMLYQTDDANVPLETELNYLDTYIALEKLRFGTNMNVDFQQSGQVNGQQIAPLLLLPLVENAFKHGLSKQSSGTWLRSELHVEPESLRFRVENSKPAISFPHKAGGLGLENLRKRLELLYPARHTLEVADRGQSFFVSLHLQF